MKRKLSFASLCFLFLISASAGFSLDIPASPAGRVSDYAGMLSAQAKTGIEDTLRNLEEQTGAQIAVATFPSLDGQSLEDFSIHLAEKWKIGRKGKDDGVILLIFRDDRKIRIEVGYGLEGTLPDAACASIIRNIMAPKFRTGDIDGGISDGVTAIIKTISGELKPLELEERRNTGSRLYVNQKAIKNLIGIFVLVIGGLILIDFFRFQGYRAGNRSYKHRYSFWEWMTLFSITFALFQIFLMMAASRGRTFGGGGGFGSSGGGGFSGGGGGFGGGGSSGGW